MQVGWGGGSTLKVLNVIQVGTLEREGSIVRGFSTNNYLQPCARADKGILSLDSSTYTKNTSFFTTADSWKIKCKIYHKIDTVQSSNAQALFMLGYSWLLVGNGFEWYLTDSNNAEILRVGLQIDNCYDRILYIELVYSNTEGYTLNGYDENGVLLGSSNNSGTTKSYSSDFKLGRMAYLRYLSDDLYLDGCSIEVNGKLWWQGVEEV